MVVLGNTTTKLITFVLITTLFFSCKEKTPKKTYKKESTKQNTVPVFQLVETPKFDSNSAYKYIEKQVDFGPRVPNSEAHKKCAEYLVNELTSFGWHVIEQNADLKAYNGKTLQAKNIIASFDTTKQNRVLLFAHWDSRPYADRGLKKKTKPILGANDGASGVGVLLEIARVIAQHEKKPKIGIDIIFFDAEDYGQPQGTMIQNEGDSWCLGSQYWAKNPHKKNYRAKYGILLDMVGAKNAQFPKEGWSYTYANDVVTNVWGIARSLGYQNYFVNNQMMGGLTDDHKYINEIAHIPSIDIIHYETARNDFGSFHHTHADNMSIIDTTTLKAVGETLLQVLYQEN